MRQNRAVYIGHKAATGINRIDRQYNILTWAFPAAIKTESPVWLYWIDLIWWHSNGCRVLNARQDESMELKSQNLTWKLSFHYDLRNSEIYSYFWFGIIKWKQYMYMYGRFKNTVEIRVHEKKITARHVQLGLSYHSHIRPQYETRKNKKSLFNPFIPSSDQTQTSPFNVWVLIDRTVGRNWQVILFSLNEQFSQMDSHNFFKAG